MTFSWIFPEYHGFQTQGINANEIDSKDSPIQTFVREVCQNSNDSSVRRPVIIEFKKFNISKSDFPDVTGYTNVLRLCKKQAGKITNNKVAIKKFELREQEISKNTIVSMRVSDFNTTGLTGSHNDDYTTPWNSITVGKGVSNKGGNAGGSKGRGKESYYKMSAIGCVFYSTRDVEGREASTGCSYQITHKDENGIEHEGFGCYYDENKKHSNTQLRLDSSFIRDTPGTDIFVPGFKYNENSDFEMKLATIRDFFISIIEGNLVVIIDGVEINKETIYPILDNLAPRTNEDAEIIERTKELIKCYERGAVYRCEDYDIYLAKSEKFYRVTSVRAGMTVSNEFHKLPHEYIIGLVIIRSTTASNALLQSEDISHNSWKPDVADKEYQSKINNLISSMKREIRLQVNEMVKREGGESKDAAGLNKYLPVVVGSEDVAIVKKEFLYDPITKIKSSKRKRNDAKKIIHSTSSIIPTRKEDENALDMEYEHDTKPVHNGNHDITVNLESPPVEPGTNEEYRRIFKVKSVNLKDIRTICTDNKEKTYKIMYDVDKDEEFFIKVHMVLSGIGVGDTVNIASAHYADGTELIVKDGRVGPINPVLGQRNQVFLKLDYPIACRIQVEGMKDA